MKKFKVAFLAGVQLLVSGACTNYLDIVPDNVATIEHAFNLRSTAERFLFTCYSFMPDHGNLTANPAFVGGDEFWFLESFNDFEAPAIDIARGTQGIVNPATNYWDGERGGKPLFQGIRDCNIFLDHIGRTAMEDDEKARWIAEAKFLKAYYHFWLIRMYGAIPLLKENVSVDAEAAQINTPQDPVDECFAYVVGLLDETFEHLPPTIDNQVTELGRITLPIAKSLKALVLVTAASPLFNGNEDYAHFTNREGVQLFNQEASTEKWVAAAQACQEAVQLCEALGYTLQLFNPQVDNYNLPPQLKIQMDLRTSVTEKWNPEIIWANTNSMVAGDSRSDIQRQAMPRGLDPQYLTNAIVRGNMAPPIRIADLFYSKHGVPVNEDKTASMAAERLGLREGQAEDKYLIREGYTTAQLNFDREPRYYASLGFDGGIWYGQGRYDADDAPLFVSARLGGPAARQSNSTFSITGYWPKKLIHFTNVIGESLYSTQEYPWPVMRLADLYLLAAEASNEAYGPSDDVYGYINKVRHRAGLPDVEEAWEDYSTHPDRYTKQPGLRDIIKRERLIELAFEGHRFWDLRRWKDAERVLNGNITGWDLDQSDPAFYYRERQLFMQTFDQKDYFWPIKEETLTINRNLVQNPGW